MAVAFVRLLRRLGVDAAVGSSVAFAQALGQLGVDRAGAVYWAGRATLVHRPEDVPTYDRAFAAFWRRDATIENAATTTPDQTAVLAFDLLDEDGAPPPEGE